MLRPIKSSHIRPRVMGYYITNAGTPSVSAGCKDDISSVTDNGAGDTTLTFFEPFQRAPLTFVAPVTTGGLIPNVSTQATTSTRVITNTSAGSGSDSDAHVICLGYDSAFTDLLGGNTHQVRGGGFAPVLLGLSFDSTGVIQIGNSRITVSAASNAYTVTFKDPFAMTPIVVPTCVGSTAAVARVASRTVAGCVIETFDAAGGAAAAACDVWILGWYSNTMGRGQRSVLQTNQRKARLVGLQLTYTAGVPAFTSGTSGDATVVDTNPGVATVTFAQPFKRTPIIIANGNGTSIIMSDTKTSSGCVIRAFNNAGSAADAGVINIGVLGFDDATTY